MLGIVVLVVSLFHVVAMLTSTWNSMIRDINKNAWEENPFILVTICMRISSRPPNPHLIFRFWTKLQLSIEVEAPTSTSYNQ